MGSMSGASVPQHAQSMHAATASRSLNPSPNPGKYLLLAGGTDGSKRYHDVWALDTEEMVQRPALVRLPTLQAAQYSERSP